jgi:hypothetical protein
MLLSRFARHIVGAIMAATILAACESPVTPSSTCAVTVVPGLLSPCVASGDAIVTVTAPSACAWTASATDPWVVVVSGASGRGTASVHVAYEANFDAPRTGVVTVRTTTAAETVRIAQAGCLYGVHPASFGFAAAGGGGTFDVVQQTDPYECGGPLQNVCVWSAMANVPWITVSTPMPRTGDDRVSFVVAANSTGVDRAGTIIVRDRVVQVSQSR